MREHADEIDTDLAVVGRLLARQFPAGPASRDADVRSLRGHRLGRAGPSGIRRPPRARSRAQAQRTLGELAADVSR